MASQSSSSRRTTSSWRCHSGCPPLHGSMSHEYASTPSLRNAFVTAWLSSQATSTLGFMVKRDGDYRLRPTVSSRLQLSCRSRVYLDAGDLSKDDVFDTVFSVFLDLRQKTALHGLPLLRDSVELLLRDTHVLAEFAWLPRLLRLCVCVICSRSSVCHGISFCCF